MRTALQELIDYMGKGHTESFLAIKAARLLEKEKIDIIDAHNNGIKRYCQYEPERHGNQFPSGEDYYKLTFK